ncbi:hypothetical protein AACJ24_000480 [Escherichia coli]|nr:hypothetical protein [Escherichia coli]EHV4541071.1 hypothetical protein [Escherichia coli]EIT7530818.1 hypothetical protein [Escherichia coli]EJC0533671.1 hypothetical protein [Escherichia coli]EJG3766304.1 hypothetical protein [Escherichia coli]EJN8016265.1 hypothetical protein [Escherichia coli]
MFSKLAQSSVKAMF